MTAAGQALAAAVQGQPPAGDAWPWHPESRCYLGSMHQAEVSVPAGCWRHAVQRPCMHAGQATRAALQHRSVRA